MQIPAMPFRILALAPFSSQLDTVWSQGPVRIGKTNLDQVVDELGLKFYAPIPRDLCPAGGLNFTCKRLKDFHPDGIIQGNAFLTNLLDAKGFVEKAKTKGLSAQEIGVRLKEWPDLPLIQIKTEHQKPEDQKQMTTSTSAVDNILKMVALPEDGPSPPADRHALTVQIDTALQKILGHVFSCNEFRNLEAVWRGLKLLIQQGQIGEKTSLEIIPVTFETLDETLRNLTTNLVRDLPSLIIVDLPFDNSPRSIELLEQIAQLAETLLVPAICWVTHNFLHIDTWQDLKRLPFLPHYLEESAYAKWRRLRQASSARWLAITCNRFLARYPYGANNRPRLVRFEETRRLWASPVWATGCLVGQSFAKNGWPTRFTEWKNIRLTDLALNTEDTDGHCPTEACFAEERMHQFIRAGIMPLVASKNQDIAFMPAETTVAGSSLSYQAFVSRVGQFVLWCKDHFRKDLEPVELQKALEGAISLFWERSGHSLSGNLQISASQPDLDNRIPIRILMEPSRQILPSGEKVELEFAW